MYAITIYNPLSLQLGVTFGCLHDSTVTPPFNDKLLKLKYKLQSKTFRQQPAVIRPSETRSSTFTPPTSANSASAGVARLAIQQEELERRAAELDRRERDLNARVSVVGWCFLWCEFCQCGVNVFLWIWCLWICWLGIRLY